MKRGRWILFFMVLALAGCAGQNRASSIISELLPQTIESVTIHGSENGELKPWALDAAGIADFRAWVEQLSLKQKTYKDGEAPNEKWAGGISYEFSINEGELSFGYSYIDAAYIWYDGDWYEITNPTEPPVRQNKR